MDITIESQCEFTFLGGGHWNLKFFHFYFLFLVQLLKVAFHLESLENIGYSPCCAVHP